LSSKSDGYRGVPYVEHDRSARLMSRNGNRFARFSELAAAIAQKLDHEKFA
jgi:hypothetical protein